MKDQYLSRTIQRAVKQDQYRPGPPPTFSGEFVPDLVQKLKDHLRQVELAQIRSVQHLKEVIEYKQPGHNRPRGKIWDQILAARKER